MPTKRPEDRKLHRSYTLDRILVDAIERLRGNETASNFVNRILCAVLVPEDNFFKLETLMREIGHVDSSAMLRHVLYEAVMERLKRPPE